MSASLPDKIDFTFKPVQAREGLPGRPLRLPIYCPCYRVTARAAARATVVYTSSVAKPVTSQVWTAGSRPVSVDPAPSSSMGTEPANTLDKRAARSFNSFSFCCWKLISFRPLGCCGIHQFSTGRWRICSYQRVLMKKTCCLQVWIDCPLNLFCPIA